MDALGASPSFDKRIGREPLLDLPPCTLTATSDSQPAFSDVLREPPAPTPPPKASEPPAERPREAPAAKGSERPARKDDTPANSESAAPESTAPAEGSSDTKTAKDADQDADDGEEGDAAQPPTFVVCSAIPPTPVQPPVPLVAKGAAPADPKRPANGKPAADAEGVVPVAGVEANPTGTAPQAKAPVGKLVGRDPKSELTEVVPPVAYLQETSPEVVTTLNAEIPPPASPEAKSTTGENGKRTKQKVAEATRQATKETGEPTTAKGEAPKATTKPDQNPESESETSPQLQKPVVEAAATEPALREREAKAEPAQKAASSDVPAPTPDTSLPDPTLAVAPAASDLPPAPSAAASGSPTPNLAAPTHSPANRVPNWLRSGGETTPESRPVVVDSTRFLHRVTRAFEAAQSRGGDVVLRLSPPELGAVQIELRVKEGVLTAKLETETTSAKTAILDNLPALKERLAEQGMRIENFEVNVGSRGNGGTPDRPQDRPERQRLDAPVKLPETTPATSASDAASRTRTWMSDGKLNVIV